MEIAANLLYVYLAGAFIGILYAWLCERFGARFPLNNGIHTENWYPAAVIFWPFGIAITILVGILMGVVWVVEFVWDWSLKVGR